MNNVYFVPPAFKGPTGQEDMPYLLTAGPLTTSRSSKIAMLSDYGAQNEEFRSLVAEIRRELKRLAGGDESHECVLLSGPGAFALEAAFGSFAPAKRKKTLVIVNGRTGEQAVAMLATLDRPHVILEKGDGRVATAEDVTAALDADNDITHIFVTQCEATSGAVTAIEDLGKIAKDRNKVFMVDAQHSFGALPLDMAKDEIDVLISTASGCLEGVPGFSFVLVKRELLIASEGKCHSVVLDLAAQWRDMESLNQFRFTPPTHALVAFRQALRELETEGGIGMRRARYQRNAEELITRMRAMGFTPLLPDTDAGPIVQCFLCPRDSKFVFTDFAEHLRQRGFEVAPGLLAKRASFRIGTIGQINDKVIKSLAKAVEAVLKEMDVQEFGASEA
jgi:2-aminoethylphosphonate-pyruvate transaminase